MFRFMSLILLGIVFPDFDWPRVRMPSTIAYRRRRITTEQRLAIIAMLAKRMRENPARADQYRIRLEAHTRELEQLGYED